MSKVTYVISEDFISIVIGNKPFSVNSTHPKFSEVKNYLYECNRQKSVIDSDFLKNLLDMKENFGKFISPLLGTVEGVSIYEDRIQYMEKDIHNGLAKQIISTFLQGFDVEPLIKFFLNLQKNPSNRAVNELFDFLEAANMISVTPDGCFLAYKKIRDDYTDIYTGKFDNSPGCICEMDRNDVNDDKTQTCSNGLHFCSYSYLDCFGTGPGNRVVVVKINPADVVSIPADYENAKGRCCRYEVVGEIEDWKSKDIFDKPVCVDFEPSTDFSDIDPNEFFLLGTMDISLDDIVEMTKEELYDFTIAELVKIYNYVSKTNLKKFRDKEVAVNRLYPILQEVKDLFNEDVFCVEDTDEDEDFQLKDDKWVHINENREDSEWVDVDDLEYMTITELTEIYNSLSFVNKIKKFRDKQTALKRLRSLANEDGEIIIR